MDKDKVKILDIKEEYMNVFTYTIEKPDHLDWEEGSSFHLALPGYDDGEEVNKKLIHHLSINTLTDEGNIRFTTKIPIRKSIFKKTLADLEVGDEVTIFKIKSHMKLRRDGRPVVLLSQGIAMSTMRPLIKAFEADSSGIPELLSINVNKKDNHLFEDEFINVDGSLCIRLWLESRREYFDKLAEVVEGNENPYYYIVGSEVFVLDTLYTLRNLGVADEDMIIDKSDDKRAIVFNTLENYKMII